MAIRLQIEGARPDEISRGLAAAQQVFEKAGVTDEEAADARFAVEGWDVRQFTGDVPEAELEICDVWDEAEDAAIAACCSGWPADRIPAAGCLELVRVPKPITRLAADDPGSERAFEAGAPGIIEQICEAGYFNDDRPEDEVVYLLDEGRLDQLTKDHEQLYLDRVLPLMRIWRAQTMIEATASREPLQAFRDGVT